MVKANGDRYWYSANDLYSVYALTDSTGAVVERYMYSPYGACIVLAADGVTVRTESLYGNPWTFTGRRLDGETGLMYFRNRMYEVGLGRFISRDPIAHQDTMEGVHSGIYPSAVESDLAEIRLSIVPRGQFYSYVSGKTPARVDPLGLVVTFTLVAAPRLLDNQKADYEFDVKIAGLNPGSRYFQLVRIEASTIACGGGPPGHAVGYQIDDLATAPAGSNGQVVATLGDGSQVKFDPRTEWIDTQGHPYLGNYCSVMIERTIELHLAGTDKPRPAAGSDYFASVKVGDTEYKHAGSSPGTGEAVSQGKLGGYKYKYEFWNPNCAAGAYTSYNEVVEQLRFYGGLGGAKNTRYSGGKQVQIPGEPPQ